MAAIFLNYRGSSSIVKPFQDSLVKQGHVVHTIGDFEFSKSAALAALSKFDCIIAVWSGEAAGGDAFLAIASEAQRLGRLSSVLAPGVLTSALPAEFREPPSLLVSDTGGIALRIKALGVIPGPRQLPSRRRERPEGIGSAASAPYRVAPPSPAPAGAPETRKFGAAPRKPSAVAAPAEAGRLVHKIPDKMWVGEPEQVEVRLGREAAAGLVAGIAGRGPLTSQDIPIVETMSIMLVSGPGAFLIEPQSEASQLVVNDLIAGTALDHDAFGRWTWLVTPKKSGAQQLLLKVSAGLKDSRGVPTSVRLPDREFKVAVSVHAGKATVRALSRAVLGFGGAVGAAFLGIVTQELWWPRIRDLLHAWGLLG